MRTAVTAANRAGCRRSASAADGTSGRRRREAPAAPAAEAPKGGQDQTGPYTVAENWPKPLSQLPGHEKWTWGAVQGIFAESPNRVFVLMRGELPLLERPAEVPYPNVGPSLSFPVSQTPFRNASVGPVTSPGNTGSDGWNGWKGKLGVDARWEHCLFVVDAEGNIIESVDAVGSNHPAAAFGVRQSVRCRKARLGRGRPAARRLQVHQRRQAAGADAGRPRRGRQRRRRTSTGRRSWRGCLTARST